MKILNVLAGFLFLISLSLTACTSQEGQLKKQSTEEGDRILLDMLKREAEDYGPRSNWLKNAYVDYILAQSTVQVASLTYPAKDAAWLVVEVETLSKDMRKNLLAVAQKVDPSKERKFNYGEAVGLIVQMAGVSREKVVQPLKTLRYTKRDKAWVLEP